MEESGVSIPQEEHENFIHEKRAYYRSIVDVQFYPGALNVVDHFKAKGLQVVIGTACSRLTMQKSLNAEYREKFDYILTGDDVHQAKPNPDPYITARKALNLKNTECIVIENAPLGIISAKASGVKCIAVASTLSKKYLKNADIIIDNVEDLLSLNW